MLADFRAFRRTPKTQLGRGYTVQVFKGSVRSAAKEVGVLGAIRNGPGKGEGQFAESNYMAMDSHGNLFTGDTGNARITEMVAAGNN